MTRPTTPVYCDCGPKPDDADDLKKELLGPKRIENRAVPISPVEDDFGSRRHIEVGSWWFRSPPGMVVIDLC